MTGSFELVLNGTRRRVDADPGRTLLSVLREELQLTGAKYGCGEGACGACTVLINGRPARSCLTSISDAAGRSITTIEGLEQAGRLNPVQQAFLDEDALQCGYCTPGMILTAVALLGEKRKPNRAEIIDAMNGNLCRCGAYGRIVQAIERAADTMGRQP